VNSRPREISGVHRERIALDNASHDPRETERVSFVSEHIGYFGIIDWSFALPRSNYTLVYNFSRYFDVFGPQARRAEELILMIHRSRRILFIHFCDKWCHKNNGTMMWWKRSAGDDLFSLFRLCNLANARSLHRQMDWTRNAYFLFSKPNGDNRIICSTSSLLLLSYQVSQVSLSLSVFSISSKEQRS